MAVAITEETTPKLSKLQPLWHRSAPRSVAENSSAGSPSSGWAAWRKHLATRRQPAAPSFLRGKEPAILWGWPEEWQRDQIESFLTSASEQKAIAAQFSIAETPSLPHGLRVLALAYMLPRLAGEMTAESWWQLAETLHDLSVEAQQHRVDWPADPADVVRQQLLAGELPLALSCLFPEVRALRALKKGARSALSEALLELTDGDGLPHARLLSVLGPLFACWTRARSLGDRLERGPWSQKAEFQYQWLVRRALQLADDGGRFLLTPPEATKSWCNSLFAAALDLAGDRGDCAAASAALPRRVVPKRFRSKANDLPEPSLNSDWSGVAVLAGGWSRDDARLALAYADEPLTIELAIDGETLLAGTVISNTTCDGAPVEVAGEWERLCWEIGKRYCFLELGIELAHGLRLERQLLFGREDLVLYLADIVVSTDSAPRQIQHSLKLPLGVDALWQPEVETRDGVIVGEKARAAVLPLGLKEWRADPRGGTLAAEGGALRLTQEANGKALCCPLFIDLDRKRAKKERTWRKLTVGESLEIVPDDLAVAYRAQSGRDQWLFYRSLGPAGNRTFLGHNISGEMTAGPLLPTGKYKEWVEIEAV